MPLTRRAYILLEALVGGALVAVVLSALYVQAGVSHQQIIAAARRTQATHLAQTALEQECAFGFLHVAARPPVELIVGGSTYSRTVGVSSVERFGGVDFKNVTVAVHYRVGGEEHDVTASSRVWSP